MSPALQRKANWWMAILWCFSALINSHTFMGFISVAVAAYHAYEATRRSAS